MSQVQNHATSDKRSLDFLWLELTNLCNLTCTHCYAESGPLAGNNDKLSANDYLSLIDEAQKLGCRQIQFIGGEPTLFPSLPKLLERAHSKKFQHIEVFSNLLILKEHLLHAFLKTNTVVGTSIYGPNEEIHEKVTQRKGSFDRTIKNICRLVDKKIHVRVGFIELPENTGTYEETKDFLNSIAITSIGRDRMRHFGRGKANTNEQSNLSELCGSCSRQTLAIGPDGHVAPCIMSKQWSLGSVLDTPLSDIAQSHNLRSLRKDIYDATSAKTIPPSEKILAQCNPVTPCFPCAPQASCPPCAPNTTCPPTTCRPYCMPN